VEKNLIHACGGWFYESKSNLDYSQKYNLTKKIQDNIFLETILR
jgi:hypothetical protein